MEASPMPTSHKPTPTKKSQEPTSEKKPAVAQKCRIHLQEFSELTGYAISTCEKILKGLTDAGYVDVLDAIRALAQYFRNTQIDQELKQKQIEVAEERRKKLELERRQKEGELVEVAKVMQVWASMLSVIRNRLLQMPQKLAPLVASSDPTEAKAILEKEFTALLSELKEDLRNELK
jgi:predicted transcriptional regulator